MANPCVIAFRSACVRTLHPPSELCDLDPVTKSEARIFVLILLNASGAVGKDILRPSPTTVLKLRGGGLVPLQKLGTALRPVANNLAAGWHGWCTLTAPVCAAGTVIALTWLASDARKPGHGRNILLKVWRGYLMGIAEVAQMLAIGIGASVVCLCALTSSRAEAVHNMREAVFSQLTTTRPRLWSCFKFGSGIIASSVTLARIQLVVPPQYQKLLFVCSMVPMGAGIISVCGPSDYTLLEMALFVGFVTAVKAISEVRDDSPER